MKAKKPHSGYIGNEAATIIGLEEHSNLDRMVLHVKPVLHRPNKRSHHRDQMFTRDRGGYAQRYGCLTLDHQKELALRLVEELAHFVENAYDPVTGIRITRSRYRDFGTRVILYGLEDDHLENRIALAIAGVLDEDGTKNIELAHVARTPFSDEEHRKGLARSVTPAPMFASM